MMYLHIKHTFKLTVLLFILFAISNTVSGATDPPAWTKTCEILTNTSTNISDLSVENNASTINCSIMVNECKIQERLNVVDSANYTDLAFGSYIVEITDLSNTCVTRNEIILCNSSIDLGPDRVLCEPSITLSTTNSTVADCFQYDCTQHERIIGFDNNDCNFNSGIQASFQSTYVENSSQFQVSNGQNYCNYKIDNGNSYYLMQIEGNDTYSFSEFEMTSERLISSLSYYHFVDRGFLIFGDCFLCNSFNYDVQILVNGTVQYEETVFMGIGNVELKQIRLANPITVGDGDIVKIVIGKDRQSCVSGCNKLEIAGINVFSCIDNSDNGEIYAWYGPNNFSSSEPSVTIDTPGVYCLNFTDCEGCTVQDCVYIIPENETCIQDTCGLYLGPDQVFCEESLVLEPLTLDIDNFGTSELPQCDCPPGYTLIDESYNNLLPGSYKLCVLGTGNYSISLLTASSISVYACGNASVDISATIASCLDVYALNGANVTTNVSNGSDIFYYLNEGSSISADNNFTTKMNIFNAGGDFNIDNGSGSIIYAVSSACATTSIGDINYSNLTEIWKTPGVSVMTQDSSKIFTETDPLHSIFDNFNGCDNDEMRAHYSSRTEVCDLLDNDFDCETDQGCPGIFVYNWSTGAQSESITVNTPGEYCLSVTHSDFQCVDCVVLSSFGVNADAGQDIFSCSPGACFYIGANLVGPEGASYSWSTGESGLINNMFNGQIEVCPTVTTSYSVTVSMGADCVDMDEITVEVAAPEAGTLISDLDTIIVCPTEMVSIAASIETISQLPSGYDVRYILSGGPELVILDAHSAPEFIIDGIGDFSIHTFVYDPTSLDLSGLIANNITSIELSCMLTSGGGNICASLDAVGKKFSIVNVQENLYIPGQNVAVAQGMYKALNTITSDGSIVQGVVVYSAGQHIDLMPGFEVMIGEEFNAIIEGCNSSNE